MTDRGVDFGQDGSVRNVGAFVANEGLVLYIGGDSTS